ncbi:DoxX family protein [Streptomyces sp. Vc74B-19]|uniref:DoxX family protein n=1 Tax=unclassified Streptomyces TaxID=2593676 RepID=UPI001BFC3DD9|nr:MULTISPECIES: DoxX family protein [unclassified Streptomyces]MBT3161648.1 DoxX family protein [Streptomyces sp. Vc74B-19]MCO4695954.1 DoxX family protein [Streptomyces sp. RO-S4]MDU0303302.1 DoxX family protein [Streptomyces sp. PAL114]
MNGRLTSAQPYALGLFRMVVGLLFACHGAVSLLGLLGGTDGNGGTVETGAWPGWYAALIELVGGGLVLLGLGTRAAAFISSGAMAYAYFKVHQPEALWPIQNHGEGAAMYCWAMLLLVFTGSGAFGLDRLLAKRSTAQEGQPAEQTPVTA